MQKPVSQPDSPSTPSALSSGIDPDFTLDDSLRGFKLGDGVSSSSHSGGLFFGSGCMLDSLLCVVFLLVCSPLLDHVCVCNKWSVFYPLSAEEYSRGI